ncbi:7922_t:CDS:2 [Paraglomus brasilianum]|uniref:7922_t:CDS:1 n=1 Tax=Paraglomus brasilianum TaxID=144538 RepID=A0A9N8YZB4_9GLOM|nr:7922_t:CDS:2 [Paraglomus brasilianum]
MPHSPSDVTFLTRAVLIVWTYFWFLQHAWRVDRFQALRWHRIKKYELKTAITILLLIMAPLQVFSDIIGTLIKYQEGFITFPNGQVITKPYVLWTPAHKNLSVPSDYVLCMSFSVQVGLLFLLQSFWNYLANNVAKASFMGSFEFKSYIIFSVFSAAVFPTLKFTFRHNELNSDIAPQLAYGVFMFIIALLGVRSNKRFATLLRKTGQTTRPNVVAKLEYFRDMNLYLSMGLVIGSVSLVLLCVDGLTTTQWLNKRKFAADLLMTHVSIAMWIVFLTLILIFYPSGSSASDSATIKSTLSNRSAANEIHTQASAKPQTRTHTYDKLPNTPESSQQSSYVIEMSEDNSGIFPPPPLLSRPPRSYSVDDTPSQSQSTLIPTPPPFSPTPTLSPKSATSPRLSLYSPTPVRQGPSVKMLEGLKYPSLPTSRNNSSDNVGRMNQMNVDEAESGEPHAYVIRDVHKRQPLTQEQPQQEAYPLSPTRKLTPSLGAGMPVNHRRAESDAVTGDFHDGMGKRARRASLMRSGSSPSLFLLNSSPVLQSPTTPLSPTSDMMPTSPTNFTMDYKHGASKRWTKWDSNRPSVPKAYADTQSSVYEASARSPGSPRSPRSATPYSPRTVTSPTSPNQQHSYQRSIPSNHSPLVPRRTSKVDDVEMVAFRSRRMSATSGKKQVRTESGGYEVQKGLDSPTIRFSSFNDSRESITHAL